MNVDLIETFKTWAKTHLFWLTPRPPLIPRKGNPRQTTAVTFSTSETWQATRAPTFQPIRTSGLLGKWLWSWNWKWFKLWKRQPKRHPTTETTNERENLFSRAQIQGEQAVRPPLTCKKYFKLTMTFFKLEKSLKLTVKFVKHPARTPWIHYGL
jgi:hypothetical protein